MPLSVGLELFIVAGIGLTAALLMVFWWSRQTDPTVSTARDLLRRSDSRTVFVFDDTTLLDASPLAKKLLERSTVMGTDWDQFVHMMEPGFPDLRDSLSSLAANGQVTLTSSQANEAQIRAEHWNGVARIEIIDTAAAPLPETEAVSRATETELLTLRTIADASPQLIWRVDSGGNLVWANRAYLDIVERAFPTETSTWPPKNPFKHCGQPPGSAPSISQTWIRSEPDGPDTCFEITSSRAEDGGCMHFAIDVTPILDAQSAQQKFVQTLTKTFAQLSVGLIIFDRDRRLALFNPALTELLALPASFLVSSPSLGSFLDRLREDQKIPEPKNYTSWRAQLEALESQAEEGTYEQVWPLANGLSYRVTGRPHPDGAIAFLFEDVSEELALTRRFRAQLDLDQQILDGFDEAVAVFAPTGEFVQSNRTYRELWGNNGHLGFDAPSLQIEMAMWEQMTAPSAAWHKLTQADEDSWHDRITTQDGVHLDIHYSVLANRHRMVRFQKVGATTASLDFLEQEPLDIRLTSAS